MTIRHQGGTGRAGPALAITAALAIGGCAHLPGWVPFVEEEAVSEEQAAGSKPAVSLAALQRENAGLRKEVAALRARQERGPAGTSESRMLEQELASLKEALAAGRREAESLDQQLDDARHELDKILKLLVKARQRFSRLNRALDDAKPPK